MNYSVVPTSIFKKETKRFLKKYPSLKQELTRLNSLLSNKPETGTSLGNNIYKIRIAIKSKGKGKSGGARIITYLVNNNHEVYLLTIYDKSELDSIDSATIRQIIKSISV